VTATADLAIGVSPIDTSGLSQALRERPVILFGAGGLGQRIRKGLLGAGIRPRAFADNNPDLWGRRIADTEILSPDDAARLYGDSGVFVMSVWRPAHSGGLRAIDRQLRRLGCDHVVPFAHVLWLFPDQLLPHYLWDLPSKIEPEWNAIRDAYSLFEDETSRAEFTSQVQFRMTGSFEWLPPIETHPQYFPQFLEPAPGECFVDCGAYDGDSIASFLQWTGSQFRKIVAFEADPSCFRKLQEFTAARPEIGARIECHQSAVAAASGTLRFNATGHAGASISSAGEIEVNAVTLDEALRDENPTFIKMDIEGAEPDALHGARETIRRTQPILAICVYHLQNHLWRVPLLMRELFPAAKFFLRTYCLDGLDTVCYAVPESRLTQPRGAL
jgi:FkbM family methyltransferase